MTAAIVPQTGSIPRELQHRDHGSAVTVLFVLFPTRRPVRRGSDPRPIEALHAFSSGRHLIASRGSFLRFFASSSLLLVSCFLLARNPRIDLALLVQRVP